MMNHLNIRFTFLRFLDNSLLYVDLYGVDLTSQEHFQIEEIHFDLFMEKCEMPK